MTPSASTLPPPQDDMAQVATLAYLHSPARRTLRPRLVVLGTSMDDAVSAAGGWIFDLSMAGWEVTVVAGDLGSPRPARILGAEALDLDSAFTHRHRRLRPQAVAISAALMAGEDRLRGRVQECLDRGLIEVSIWGRQFAEEAGDRTESTTHRLSHAARVFKQQALRVVRGEAGAVAPTENFRTGITSRFAPHGRDLVRTDWPVK
ncbi:hypothetical protein [Nocardia carnea]|uniref:hypothetical protein n=1 Tax=Nocardia carnea TaxID=37328 RepID=UPI002455DEAA|nr:hypothetical protein [Nocardia carnea]